MAKTVALLDYGAGNVRSAQRALERVGAEVAVTADPKAAVDADGLLVPGVGAFDACMRGLNEVQGPRVIGQRLAGERPVLGICVGMQVLFESGWSTTSIPPAAASVPAPLKNFTLQSCRIWGGIPLRFPSAAICLQACPKTSGSILCIPMASAAGSWKRKSPVHPWSAGPSTRVIGLSRRWKMALCGRPNSTRKNPGTLAHSFWKTGCARSR